VSFFLLYLFNISASFSLPDYNYFLKISLKTDMYERKTVLIKILDLSIMKWFIVDKECKFLTLFFNAKLNSIFFKFTTWRSIFISFEGFYFYAIYENC